MKFIGGFFGKKHRPLRLTKNPQYIAMKRDRLSNEMAEIERAEQVPRGRVAMFSTSGVMRTEQASLVRQLKEYQIATLDWIERADAKTLYDRLQERRARLCPACQSRLADSVPMCQRDFQNFVYCDILFQALGLNHVAKWMEVPK